VVTLNKNVTDLLMELFMKANGTMEKRTVMVFLYIQMVHSMMVGSLVWSCSYFLSVQVFSVKT